MKKMKRNIAVCIALVSVLVLSACGDGTVAQGINNPYGGTFAIEEIQDSPAYYVGTITLIGIVSDSATQDFALQNGTGAFEVLVDYRGNQALPQLGDKIIAEGNLRENRPCCGPGFTLTSIRFEAVSN